MKGKLFILVMALSLWAAVLWAASIAPAGSAKSCCPPTPACPCCPGACS